MVASRARKSSLTSRSKGLEYPRFVKRFLLFLAPVVLVWLVLTPAYNSLLTATTDSLVRLFESPRVTSLKTAETHYFLVHRSDLQGRGRDGSVSSVRVTDTHFPVIFAVALFLAVPEVPLKRRLRSLVVALSILFVFHVLSLVFWVQFIYATQLHPWSAQNYSVGQQRFWGLGKHLLDLPFKFAMPLILWCAFFFDRLAKRDG